MSLRSGDGAEGCGPTARPRRAVGLLRLAPVLALCLVPTPYLAGSCAAGGAPRESRADPTDPAVAARRERQREALAAWRQGEEAWLERRGELLQDPAVAPFLVDNLVVVLVRTYEAGQVPREGPPRHPHERARAELVRLAEHSAPVLAELLIVGDGVVSYLAGDVLRRLRDPRAAAQVADRLGVREAEGRRRAAELLADLPHAGEDEPRVRARLAALLAGDAEWVVRAQAALAIGSRGGRDPAREADREILVRALSDPDPTVREYAARGLARLGDVGAVPALVAQLERAIREGRGPAEMRVLSAALRRLTGVPRDLDAAGWRAWLNEHAGQLAPTPLAPAPR